TIRVVRPQGYAFSFVTFGLAPAALGSLLAAGATPALTMLAITAVARLLSHFTARDARSALLQLWVLPLADLLGFALWCWGFATRRVQWGQTRYRDASCRSADPVSEE